MTYRDFDFESVNDKMPFNILDANLKCIGGNGMLGVGVKLSEQLHVPPTLPIAEYYEGSMTIGGRFYCVRIFPFDKDIDARTYLCDIVSEEQVYSMAEKTDSASKMLSMYADMDFRMCALRDGIKQLCPDLPEMLDFHISSMCSRFTNLSAYTEMLYAPPDKVVFDVNRLCRMLVDTCNAYLAKRNRSISFFPSSEYIYIRADSRMLVISLLNALQNAVMYSPADTVPVVSVSPGKGNRSVMITVTNEDIKYSEKEFSEGIVDFGNPRIGIGLPMIKRFAKLCNGSFKFVRRNGKAELILTLPAMHEDDVSDYTLQEDIKCTLDGFAQTLIDSFFGSIP